MIWYRTFTILSLYFLVWRKQEQQQSKYSEVLVSVWNMGLCNVDLVPALPWPMCPYVHYHNSQFTNYMKTVHALSTLLLQFLLKDSDLQTAWLHTEPRPHRLGRAENHYSTAIIWFVRRWRENENCNACGTHCDKVRIIWEYGSKAHRDREPLVVGGGGLRFRTLKSTSNLC
jgi:hypothetical protein